MSALIAMNRPDQLRAYLRRARESGRSNAEQIEAITHLASYADSTGAVKGVGVARDVNKDPQA